MNQEIKNFIIKLICFYDNFNIPLSYLDIKNKLPQKISNINLKKTLSNLIKQKKLVHQSSYYFLPGRDRIIKLFSSRQYLNKNRFKTALKAARILSFIPFIKLIGVTNSLSFHNSNQNSDIDFFIITQKDRLWLTRFFSVLVLDIFRLAKNKHQIQGKICLGNFVDEDFSDLSKLNSKKDFYQLIWSFHFMPIYEDNFFLDFTKSNSWIKKSMPYFTYSKNNLIKKPFLNKILNVIISIIFYKKVGDIFEDFVRIIQIKRFKKIEKDKLAFSYATRKMFRHIAYDKNKKYNDLTNFCYLRNKD